MEAGEYAVRGSLIDLFPAGAEEGIRIDLFGDEVESLRGFDPLTQLSGDTLKSLELRPVSEVLLTPESIARFRARYRELFGAVTGDDPLYEAISNGRAYAGMEHWLPLFYETLDTLADYTPGATFSMDYRVPRAAGRARIRRRRLLRGAHPFAKARDSVYHPCRRSRCSSTPLASPPLWRDRPQLSFSPFAPDDAIATALPVAASPQLFHRRAEENVHPAQAVNDYLAGAGKPVVLAAAQLRQRRAHPQAAAPEGRRSRHHAGRGACSTGLPRRAARRAAAFEHRSSSSSPRRTCSASASSARRRKNAPRRHSCRRRRASRPGELIVHREHGIGKFDGLVTLDVNAMRHDCLKLAYDGGTLFLPVENIDLVSRYGTAEETGAARQAGRRRLAEAQIGAEERLKIAAEALLRTAAERAAKPAPVLLAESGAYDEFCARFPYSETDDQLQAIEDVRADLGRGHAMDRLICGDVGFGKTEVALRAAFIAALLGLPGRGDRADDAARPPAFPDLPRALQRASLPCAHALAPDARQTAAETKKQLAEGTVDIVIGTHALLAASVQFKRLALLVVDEEQHFGVGQKEKLKALKSEIHVLTLSATPIPRTLQMALSGVRELSLIATPPVDRLAVRTHVMPFDPRRRARGHPARGASRRAHFLRHPAHQIHGRARGEAARAAAGDKTRRRPRPARAHGAR